MVLTTSAQTTWLDYNTGWSVNNPIVAGSGTEQWQASSGTSGTITTATTLNPLYYHQYKQTLSYLVVDGGSPAAPTATGASLGSVYAPSLTTAAMPYWFDASGSITISTPTGTNEQWAPNPASISATQANTTVVSMYNQYKQTLSYLVVDGGSPAAPTATGASLGSVYAPSLTTAAMPYWFDASGSITISTPTGTNEQWAPNPASISATQANTTVVSMYNQYKQTLSYLVVDGGSPAAPTATGASLGSVYAPSLTTAAMPYWFDASGSIAFSTYTSGTERWAPNPASISATQANTTVVSMYNQYQVTATYSSSDSSTPSAAVILSGTQFNSSYTLTLNTSNQTTWLDNGTAWSVNNQITSGTGTQRWIALIAYSGTVSSAVTIAPSYLHEYMVTMTVSPPGYGTITAPSGPSGTLQVIRLQYP